MLLCTSLARASLEYYLDRLPQKPKIVAFPGSTSDHLGGQDDAALLRDMDELPREAERVLEKIRIARSTNSRLFLVLVKSRVNKPLEDALTKDPSVQRIRSLGVFKQAGFFDDVEAHIYTMSGTEMGMHSK